MSRPVVHVVDDDQAMRDSLRWLLESDGLSVRLYPDANAFLAGYRSDSAGCLLLDVRMPGMSGLQLQDVLRERRISLPIVFITAHGDVPMAVRAVQQGALDFVEKPFDDEALIGLIRRALGMDAAARRVSRSRTGFAALLATLTRRESEVLDRVLAGASNKVIAAEMGITIKTVETHRSRIMEKLGVATIAELVQRVVTHRLASGQPDEPPS